jgi:hypothetical protein
VKVLQLLGMLKLPIQDLQLAGMGTFPVQDLQLAGIVTFPVQDLQLLKLVKLPVQYLQNPEMVALLEKAPQLAQLLKLVTLLQLQLLKLVTLLQLQLLCRHFLPFTIEVAVLLFSSQQQPCQLFFLPIVLNQVLHTAPRLVLFPATVPASQ